jgi:hypothetical protein
MLGLARYSPEYARIAGQSSQDGGRNSRVGKIDH